MNKVILMSIQPKHLVNILNGYKTLELRKTVSKDYKGWVYIYCTKGIKDILYKYKDKYYTQHYLTFTDSVEVLNSKVVARFWFDDYDIIENFHKWGLMVYDKENKHFWEVCDPFTSDLSLTYKQVNDYIKVGEKGYVWHIDNLEIFDKPKELWDFHTRHDMLFLGRTMAKKVFQFESVNKAPQSWQYAYKGE